MRLHPRKQRHAVAQSSLAAYDGSAGVLVDTNVWVDCMHSTSPWHRWALDQLQACSQRCPLHVNLIIYAELLMPGTDVRAVDAMLDVYDTQRSAIPWSAASLAAAAFGVYRRGGGLKNKPLPDFFIGAHAAVANFSVLTRDPKPYRNCFARLALVAP